MKNAIYILLFLLFAFSACNNPVSQAESATLKYHGNGGLNLDDLELETMSGDYFVGDVIKLIDNYLFRYPDHTFTGWNTKADGTGLVYLASEETTIKETDTIFYAQWRVTAPLEALDGMNHRLKTQYEVVDGQDRVLKEWSWSWDNIGTESFDYYAEYSYTPTENRVNFYDNESKTTFYGNYIYTLENGNIVNAAWRDSAGDMVQQWVATYNDNGKYLTYKFYNTDTPTDDSVIESRLCSYAPDGINYTREVYFYGNGTDEALDLMQMYIPTYKNEDPSTGIILEEVQTEVMRPDTEDQESDNESPLGEYTNTTYYLFSWVNDEYIYQQTAVDDLGSLLDSINYTYEDIAGEWLKTSRLYTVQNSPVTYDTYQYNANTGRIIGREGFNILDYDKQMDLKDVYRYEEDENGNLYSFEENYAYNVSRGNGGTGRVLPGFKNLPASRLK